METNKTCVTCSKALKGRTDKKFCDDFCRNQHHNQLKGPENNFMRNVSNALLKNRRILKNFFLKTTIPHKILKSDLLLEGFVFRYHTHKNKTKIENLMCFDYGVTMSDEHWCYIVREDYEAIESHQKLRLKRGEQSLNFKKVT